MTIIQLLLSLALLFLSVFSVFFWLLIPLMIQVIIDKVIVQNSPDTLNVLGLFLIVVTLVASASEIGLTTLTAFFSRNGLAQDIFLKFAATLPKVLAMLVVMAVYSLQLAFASTVLTALACGTYYLPKYRTKIVEPPKTLPSSVPG